MVVRRIPRSTGVRLVRIAGGCCDKVGSAVCHKKLMIVRTRKINALRHEGWTESTSKGRKRKEIAGLTTESWQQEAIAWSIGSGKLVFVPGSEKSSTRNVEA